MVHLTVGEGLTMAQHERVMDEVAKYEETDPQDLPLESQHLLEIDFAALGEGPTVEK